ncbi:GNAT family N-acetyltransferase [Paraglaciecola sp.]|uniref:GNAT family N-acetyltransferase n=1 Tax=Paraglaciecola sp. TaxID=1920173 RepID=UPI0030F37488
MKNTLQTSLYNIHCVRFSELSITQFYMLAKLRQDVFIVEQQSIYTDLDGLDSEAIHFLCWSSIQVDTQLIGYARYRLCESSGLVKIERVVLAAPARGKGVGKQLMQTILQDIQTQHAGAQISLSSQVTAQAFYQKLGFVATGECYDDGGIEHITMCYLP